MNASFNADLTQPLHEHDTVILMVHNKGGFTVKIEREKTIKVCKEIVKLDMLIGCSYGDVFTKDSGEWVKIKRNDPHYQQYRNRIRGDQSEESISNALDNRNIQDTNTAQKLSYDDIQRLKKDKNVQELIGTIVDNSETFSQKTKMAQEKYIMRKEARHVKLFYVRPCDLYTVCNCYFNSFPHKIGYLNFANLGMMLYLADIRYGYKVMVFDHALGLLTGAISQRLAGSGKIYRLVTKGVSDKILHELGVSYFDNIVSIDMDEYVGDDGSMIEGKSSIRECKTQSPLNAVTPITEGVEKSSRRNRPSADERLVQVEDDTMSDDDDSDPLVDDTDTSCLSEGTAPTLKTQNKRLLKAHEFDEDGTNGEVPTKKQAVGGIYPLHHPSRDEVTDCKVIIGNISYNKCDKLNRVVAEYTSKLKQAADTYLELGGRLVVFGQQYQPMAALQSALTRSDNYVNVKFDEIFIREYQMLPLRTHPMMRSEVRPFCGFIVSATKTSSEITS